MLKKTARLSRSEFTKVFSQPVKRVYLPFYTFYYSPSPTFLVSVVVGKKVAKLAVKRNHLKREIYGLIQQKYSVNPNLQGSYIFIIKTPYAQKTKAERQVIIKTMLKFLPFNEGGKT